MRLARVVLAGVLGLALAPATASADAVVDTVGENVVYTGDPGPDNVLVQVDDFASNVGFGFHRRSSAAALDAAGGCVIADMDDYIFCGGTDTESLVFELGDGDDIAEIDRGDLVEPYDVPTEMDGGSGDDRLYGGIVEDDLIGGGGHDRLYPFQGGGTATGGAGNDTITSVLGPVIVTGGSGKDAVEFTGALAREISLDGAANDPYGSNLGADIEVVSTGSGDDVVTGSAVDNEIVTGAGEDVIDPGEGNDSVFGGAGDDHIDARDGWVDHIDCGDGSANVVLADFRDVVQTNCEIVDRKDQDDDNDGVSPPADCDDHNRFIKPGAGEIPGNGVDEDCSGADAAVDNDGDGVSPPADCNDANAGIRPGAVDVRGNGIDEDCSGADGSALDRDGDGANAPADCDDGNPAIRPGAEDRPQNGVDEDCSGADADWLANAALVRTNWTAFPRFTRTRTLTVRRVPKGARVRVRCRGRGCPLGSKRVKVRRGKAKVTKLLKGARLRKGARIEIRITAPETMGKVLRYTIRAGKLPSRRELCLPPGARKPRRC